jgi:predicted PurR-regulated permease PerM
MNTGTIAILLWVITVVGFIFNNLWQRINKLEKITDNQSQRIAETKQAINNITLAFDKIDEEQTFRSNDYVGQMWLELKNLNESLKQYKE